MSTPEARRGPRPDRLRVRDKLPFSPRLARRGTAEIPALRSISSEAIEPHIGTVPPEEKQTEATGPVTQADILHELTNKGRYRDIITAIKDNSLDKIPRLNLADALILAADKHIDKLGSTKDNFTDRTQALITGRQANVRVEVEKIYGEILGGEGVEPIEPKPKKRIGF
ncbi:MAG TPA: hypothetical protein VNA13_00290 [Xanthomonadales bacterium]|nr:hypothetical protein [Xanthomonadales bacterium]